MTQDVGSDPTVGVPGFCTICGLPIRCSFCEDMTSHGHMWEAERVEYEGSNERGAMEEISQEGEVDIQRILEMDQGH